MLVNDRFTKRRSVLYSRYLEFVIPFSMMKEEMGEKSRLTRLCKFISLKKSELRNLTKNRLRRCFNFRDYLINFPISVDIYIF